MKKRAFCILSVIGCAIVLIGLYVVLDSLSDLRNDIAGLRITLQLSGTEPLGDGIVSEGVGVIDESSAASPDVVTTPAQDEKEGLVVVPTAIILNTESSPLLQPQTNIAIIIESVSNNKEGDISVNIRAFTSEASSYSALEPRGLFELVSLTGANQKPLKVVGSFDSIPPRSVATGSIIFKTKSEQRSIILQIVTGDAIKHYEFNFENRAYKETVLG